MMSTKLNVLDNDYITILSLYNSHYIFPLAKISMYLQMKNYLCIFLRRSRDLYVIHLIPLFVDELIYNLYATIIVHYPSVRSHRSPIFTTSIMG